MIKVVIGDLLEAEENILVHQVNAQGKMGSGIAKQIRTKYPKVYEEYKAFCDNKAPQELIGKLQAVNVDGGKIVINLFGQYDYGYDGERYTSYDALYDGLEHIKKVAKENKLSVAVPHSIGCGLGGANWSIVYKIIEEIFEDYEVTIYKLEEK